MSSIAAILGRLETHTLAASSKGKAIAESSDLHFQVTSQSPRNQPEVGVLGYRGTQQVFASRESLLKKIELPVFDGSMPYRWICRVERYFRVAQYTEEQKLELVSLSLIGPVLNWYTWEAAEELFITWIQFKRRMLERFAESIDDEPRNRLCSLKQTGSIQSYVSEFDELITLVKGIDEDNLVSKFYTGLKLEMQEVIKMKEPNGLRNHIAAVVKMESSVFCQLLGERNNSRYSDKSNNTYRTPRVNTYTPRLTQTSTTMIIDKPKMLEAGKPVPPPFARPRQHLTPAELAELKRLKLCFKCGAKWFKGHICSNLEL